MKTPRRVGLRLLSALEDLAAQEARLLEAEDYSAVVATQNRAAPLVEEVAALAETFDPAAKTRLTALRAQRQESFTRLAEHISRGREELGTMQLSQRRLTQIAPVYGGARTAPTQQWQAVG